jgi:hypothetical protein
MKRYKIIVTTIQGYKRYFCRWKMGDSWNTRLVTDRNDYIVYTDNEIYLIEKYLIENLEKLQIKSFRTEEISYQPDSFKARKQSNSAVFRSDAKHIERYGPIL